MLSDIRVSIRFRILQVKWYVVEKYMLYYNSSERRGIGAVAGAAGFKFEKNGWQTRKDAV